MQSDKLPTMPDAEHFAVLSRIYSDSTRATASEVYTAQQMQDYALAARKMALSEVRRQLIHDYSRMADPGHQDYSPVAAEALDVFEGWVEQLMEQDA